MTNKISSASQTVRAFNVGTLGDCSAWDDNLDAATLEWLPAEEAPSFMSGTGSDEVCESGIGFAREREGCCMCSFGFDAVGVRNGDSELLESMRDRNVRHASSEIDVGKSSVGNDELDSDKQSFWVQNGIGRRFLSPDVFIQAANLSGAASRGVLRSGCVSLVFIRNKQPATLSILCLPYRFFLM